jgi:disulfide bond formation protein DsbB
MSEFINQLLSIGSILVLVLSFLAFLGNYVLSLKRLGNYVALNKMLLIGLISLVATTGSLIYSIGIGYPPCELCWYQRIFIYSTAIIALTSAISKKTLDTIYIWVLTIIGLAISFYHNLIYYTDYSPLPCDASASCTAKYVNEYGFMSIPLMALMLFISVMFILGSKKSISASLE